MDVGPRLVRKIKIPRKNPTAWSSEELARMFAAAADVPGIFDYGVPRGLYLETLLRAGYETGLRRRDLLLLRADAVSDDGTVSVTISKTGFPHVAKMREKTLAGFRRLEAILQFHEVDYQEFPLFWPYTWQQIYPYLQRITAAAGVPHGALHQLRRSGATHCEKELPGSASAYLGHASPGLAFAHYVDRRQLRNAYVPPDVPPRHLVDGDRDFDPREDQAYVDESEGA